VHGHDIFPGVRLAVDVAVDVIDKRDAEPPAAALLRPARAL
jgi:hypothetical protein